MSCPATLGLKGQSYPCDWPGDHTGHAHHNHEINASWTGDDAELFKAMRVLQADLDVAQDEIEKLLSEKEALREQAMPSKEHMMSAIHTVLHPACDQPDDCIVDIYTAEDIIFAITGGAS